MKGHVIFQGEMITKLEKYMDEKFRNLVQNQPNFAQSILGIQVYSKEGLGASPFPRGDNNEIAKIYLQNLKKNFFSRTTEPISTKLSKKHPWVKGIQVCSKEGPCPFPRGDNNEIAKIQ